MRTIAVSLLLLAGAQALSAPAPLPRHPRHDVKPGREHWEIDFSPLAKAGQVNLGIELLIHTADGNTRRLSVGQSGQVLIAPIIDAFARAFDKEDLVIDRETTRMTLKSMRGVRVRSVELRLRNIAPSFAPVVLPPGRR